MVLADPRKNTPKRCVFETTSSCNLRCRHCDTGAGKARTDELTTNEIKDLFRQLAALGCTDVDFAGGEPMLRPDWLELLYCAKLFGLNVTMYTNATLFDHTAARHAKEAGLAAVGFGIDGIGQTHDAIRGKQGHFRTLTQAIQVAKDVGLPFRIITTANKKNMNELKKIHDFTKDVGAKSWQIQPTFKNGNSIDAEDLRLDLMELADLQDVISKLVSKKQQSVTTDQHSFGIESNGIVKGFLSAMSTCKEGQGYSEGDIRESSLDEIWRNSSTIAHKWQTDTEPTTTPNVRQTPNSLHQHQLLGELSFGQVVRGGTAVFVY